MIHPHEDQPDHHRVIETGQLVSLKQFSMPASFTGHPQVTKGRPWRSVCNQQHFHFYWTVLWLFYPVLTGFYVILLLHTSLTFT